jgi:hypothetical protein
LGEHVDRAVVDSNPAVGAALPGGSSMLTPASACVTEPAGKSFEPAVVGAGSGSVNTTVSIRVAAS